MRKAIYFHILQKGGESAEKRSFTKIISKGDTLAVKFPDPSASKLKDGLAGSLQDVAYGTVFQAYINPQGLMKMSFAVDLMQNSMPPLLWRESVYNVSADPSFLLPNKFTLLNGVWKANTDYFRATEMRGVQFYDYGESSMNNPFFEAGKSYTVQVPIYNASFVDAPSFKVRLSYLNYNDRRNLSKAERIQDVTVSNLKGWTTGTEANKTYAVFKWDVPSNMKLGNYMLLAEIDPDNKISEVHEAYSKTVSGGNNTGYVMVTVRGLNTESDSGGSKGTGKTTKNSKLLKNLLH